MTQTAYSEEAKTERRQWELALSQLADQIEAWCKAHQWAVTRHLVPLEEKALGNYQGTSLHVHTGKGAMIVEPVARELFGPGDGRVDLYGLGSFRRLLLIRQGNTWALYTDDRVPWPLPWSESTFIQVAEALTAP